MIKLLIADDHQLFINGLRSLFENESNIKVVGEALNGKEVIDVLLRTEVDIILLDLKMPDTDILLLTKEIRTRFAFTKIIILTMFYGSGYYYELLKIGIQGYLFKSVSKEELLETIEKVYGGEVIISKELPLVDITKKRKHFSSSAPTPLQLLTQRELNILQLIAQDYSKESIAEKMLISPHTVAVHHKNIMLKLGVKSHSGLIQYCNRNNLLG
jgi:DNA-binding NarL/FixJ family response regulator